MPDPNVTLANTLYDELIAGSGITIPVIDLTDPEFAQPVTGSGSLYDALDPLTDTQLTSRTVGGTGVFDGLMDATKAHLQAEFEKGRITGKEYAEVYLGSMQGAMNTALQFLLGRDQAYWQAQLVQRQARIAEIQAVTERARLEIAKAELAMAVSQAHLTEVQFARGKLELAVVVNQIELTDAEVLKITAEVNELLPAQIDAMQAEAAAKQYQVSYVLPAQVAGMDAETDVKAYELKHIMPQVLAKSTKEVEVLTANISKITADKDQTLYQTANLLPAQKDGLETDVALKTYQLTYSMPAQLAGLNADNLGKEYNNDFVLPEQYANLKEQTEANRGKTLDTRRDLTPISGQLGVQKALQEEQITSYKRDAESKLLKMAIDSWITQKSLDDGIIAPTELTNPNLDTMIASLRTKLNM